MKKLKFLIALTILMVVTATSTLNAQNIPEKMNKTSDKEVQTRSKELLLSRLNQINDMDKSELSTPDKRLLRKEVKGIQRDLKTISGGVYISVGAIIIILILLIILL